MTRNESSYWAYDYYGRYRLTRAKRYSTTASLAHRYRNTYALALPYLDWRAAVW